MAKLIKVEIILPFNDGQKKGDIRYMKEKSAYNYAKEGLVKILDEKFLNNFKREPTQKTYKKEIKTEPKKMDKITIQPKNNNIDVLDMIISRHKSQANPCYMNVFACDDKKKESKIYSFSYNLQEKQTNFIKNELETYNLGSYGVFFNFNLLEKPERKNSNITKILYIFIDLDDAKEEHNDLIKINLENKNITYCYNAKSGHGYHFLIPIELDPENKSKVKGFLTYLKNNVCDKVDVATHTNERLIRSPNSFHNKDEESKQLITLHSHIPTTEEIQNNSLSVLNYQETQFKGSEDLKYQTEIKREDIFFSTLLTSSNNWNLYKSYLDKSTMRNNIFIKNLGIYLSKNSNLKKDAFFFLDNWEKSRIPALEGWIKKSNELNMNVNYPELLKWSKENDLPDFIELLQEQLKESFLDEYEFYYLEAEKNDYNYLMYYVNKNYYVQKSFNDIIMNIYYDCKEKGLDLVQELDLKNIYDKWEEFSFKKQMMLIQDQIKRILEQQNRIKKVYNINYEPTNLKIISNNNKKFFNTYIKPSLWDFYEKKTEYHFPNIKELLLNLCNKNEEYYLYLCKWLAWQIQNPDIKIPTAIILQGRQGSGKGTFKDLILDKIFEENCQEINQTDLECSFNDYLMGKQIIVANEVMHNENRQTLPNVLKNLVTDPKITIKQKFLKSIVGRNYTHWIFCTNSDNPIKIEEDDRRYSVFYSEKLRPGLSKDIRSNIDYEIKDFICFLKDIEVIFEDVSEPILTDAKKDIIELNKDSVHKFMEFMQQFNDLNEAFISIYGHNLEYHINDNFGDGEQYILTEKIYLLYEKWCEKYKEKGIYAKQNFSKRLSNKNIKSQAKWSDNRTFKMYSLSDLNKLMGI